MKNYLCNKRQNISVFPRTCKYYNYDFVVSDIYGERGRKEEK